MSRQLFIAAFKHEDDLLHAVADLRQAGYVFKDAYTPYPVHGLPEAMGIRPSRLPWVCFLCGLTGGLLALIGQYYLSAVEWPINVGGKPWNSSPAFIPITFELTVLSAGLGSLAAFLWRYKLIPGRQPPVLETGANDDQFVLAIPEHNATFNPQELKLICNRHHAIRTEQRIEPDGQAQSIPAQQRGAA
ncbi:MAG: DUF3341 domain-containing protein [Phycisphaerales bacterium]|jgi:hypothetical protein|nr:DUF3341 domain-containing protein [Phycisphaerales bacterium]